MDATRAPWTFLRPVVVALLTAHGMPAQSPAAGTQAEAEALVVRLGEEDTPELRRRLVELGPAAVDALHAATAAEDAAQRIRCLEVLASIGLRGGDTSDELMKAHGGRCRSGAEFVVLLEALAAVLPLHAGFRRARLDMGDPQELQMPDGLMSWFEVQVREEPPADLMPRLRLAQGRMEMRAFFVVGADSTVEELAAALEHRYPLIRELAAELLALRGRDAALTTDALLRALDADHAPPRPTPDFDETSIVQRAAALALIAVTAGEAPSAAGHGWMATHGDAAERSAALAELRALGPDAAPAVPALLKVLGTPEDPLAKEAILALAGIGPTASRALPRLRELCDHDDPAIAKLARAAIASISR